MPPQDLRDIARRVLDRNLGAATDETLVVVMDDPEARIGRALVEAGRELGLEAGLVEMAPRERSGVEPPEFVAAAMAAADVVVCPTSTSLTHTRARQRACQTGTRVATMPSITESMFRTGAMTADYQEVARTTAAVSERLTAADEARIETPAGTLTLSLSGRSGHPSDGLIREPGASGNLPSGEAYLAPVEGTARGTIAFDGGVVGVGGMDEPLVVEVADGSVVEASGAAAGEFLESTAGDPCARQVCELGIGTNPAAEVIGNVLEDEKVYGTCHLAFGDNAGFGGTIDCDSHVDGIVRGPDVYLDDERLVGGGEILL